MRSPRSPRRVLVVGAGIGGLTASLALARAGFRVTTFEQAPRFEPAGLGIQISPNASRLLIHLGLGAALAPHAVEPQALESRCARTGRAIVQVAIAERARQIYGAPYWHLHRADLQRVLAAACGDVEFGARVTAFEIDGDRVVAELDGGTSVEGDALVGADGIHSVVRARLVGPEQPVFSGNVAWRALIPADRLPPMPASATVWWGPGRHVVHYLVSAGRFVNVVAVERSRDAAAESWLAEGSPGDLARSFSSFHPDVQRLLQAVDRVFRSALYDRPALAAWGRGPVTLLGDAAHPMLPFQAQGAAQAIEDALALSSALAAAPGALAPALRRYEQLRAPRTAAIQATSRSNERLFHVASPLARFVRDTAVRAAQRVWPERTYRRLDAIYRYDVLDLDWKEAGHSVARA